MYKFMDNERLIEKLIDVRNEIYREGEKPNTKHLDSVIKNFLLHNCVHTVIMDDIDITPEKSMTVYYCSKCEITLQHPN